MERRVTSHTEEEEMNQRRRLLTMARKGDQKSIELLFELYQVKVFSGEALKKKKLPSFPVLKPTNGSGKGRGKAPKKKGKTSNVSLTNSTPTKEEKEKAEPLSKGQAKAKAKTETGQSSIKKLTKPTVKKNLVSKKATVSEKKTSAKESKLQTRAAIKKPRMAKKK